MNNKYVIGTVCVILWIVGLVVLSILSGFLTYALIFVIGGWTIAIMFPWALVSGMLYGRFVTKWLRKMYTEVVE